MKNANLTITNLVSYINTSAILKTDTNKTLKMLESNKANLNEVLPLFATLEEVKNMNQKALMRFIQSVCFTLSGNVSYFDMVSAYHVSALVLSKQAKVSYSDMHFLCGINKENANNVQGVSRARLSKFIGACGSAGTVKSKTSRTVGKKGMFNALGLTTKADNNTFEITSVAKSSPFVLSYARQLELMTNEQFRLITEKTKK